MAPIFIPKGGLVSWNLWALHRRKDYFGEDAEVFRPERWLDGEEGEEGEEGMGEIGEMGGGKGKGGKKKGLRPGWEYLRKFSFHFPFPLPHPPSPFPIPHPPFLKKSEALTNSLSFNPKQPSTAEPESASANNSLSQKQVMSLYEFVKNFPVCYILFIIKNININIKIKININIKIIVNIIKIIIMMVRRRRRKRMKRRRNLGGNF